MNKLLLLLLSLSFISCGLKNVENGNIAIVVDSFSKNVHDEVATSGLQLSLFTTYHEVDATDIRVEIQNLQPKDGKGMKFENVDLTTTVRIVRKNAVTLYKETKEINYVDHNENYVLGYSKLEQIIRSSTMSAFQSLEYQDFMGDRSVLELRIKKEIENNIEKLMYSAYTVKGVSTKTLNLMPAIEASFQNRSLVVQKELLVKSEERLMLKKLEVEEKEMIKLKDIAQKSGITVQELIDYKINKERNEVLSDLAKGDSGKVLLQVDK